MIVLKIATNVSVTLNIVMLFMSLRCNCMMSLAYYPSVNMQRLCKIELELPASRSFAQRKQVNRRSHTNGCRTSACSRFRIGDPHNPGRKDLWNRPWRLELEGGLPYSMT